MIVKFQWQSIVNELHEWDDIIGKDVVNAILSNLVDLIEDEDEE